MVGCILIHIKAHLVGGSFASGGNQQSGHELFLHSKTIIKDYKPSSKRMYFILLFSKQIFPMSACMNLKIYTNEKIFTNHVKTYK
jgi:hypothetical protein